MRRRRPVGAGLACGMHRRRPVGAGLACGMHRRRRRTVAFAAASGGPTVYVSELEIRVRYAETDQMRVAHHAGYLVWFEAGRTEFIRACGRSYAQLEEDGWLLVVIEAHCRYRHPARYDEILMLRTRLRDLGSARVTFGYELLRASDGVVLADGWTVHA